MIISTIEPINLLVENVSKSVNINSIELIGDDIKPVVGHTPIVIVYDTGIEISDLIIISADPSHLQVNVVFLGDPKDEYGQVEQIWLHTSFTDYGDNVL